MSSYDRYTKSLDECKIKTIKNLKSFPKLKPNLTEANNNSTKLNNLKKTTNYLSCDSFGKSRVSNPFDNLATAIVTSSVNYLIKKSTIKEKTVLFEKNNLCKLHYPLICFISNRKTNNNSAQLMENLLNNDNVELTKLPKSIENQTHSPLNHQKRIKFNEHNYFNNRYSLSNYKYNKISEALKLSINNTINNSSNLQRVPDNLKFKHFSSILNNDDLYRTNNYNGKTKRENKIFCLKNFYNNDRMYLLGNESVNLFNHHTNSKNRNILNSKFYGMKSYLRNKSKDNNLEKIIKDISLLKSNNRIMPLQIDENYN